MGFPLLHQRHEQFLALGFFPRRHDRARGFRWCMLLRLLLPRLLLLRLLLLVGMIMIPMIVVL
jgi:hypothetical protein